MKRWFENFATVCAYWCGHPASFVASLLLVVIWGATGPLFGYSDTWQLFINTTTTVITFWMVFVIQTTQNRDMLALQAKLDELILAVSGARDEMMHVEGQTADDIEQLRRS